MDKQDSIKFQRSEDFTTIYANNVGVESTLWDLRLVFGEIDPTRNLVEQHTAVTLPWSVVKVLIHILRSQVAAYEIGNGKVKLHPSLMPPEVPIPPKEVENEESIRKTYEELKKLRDEFIAQF